MEIYHACKSGNKELVENLINNSDYSFMVLYNCWPYENLIGRCIYNSCYLGNLEIVELLIEKCMSNNLDEYLYGSCRGGHLNIINYIIDKGATNFNWGILGAIENNHMEIAEYMASLGASTDFNFSFNIEYRRKYVLHLAYKDKFKKYKDKENVFKYLNFNDDIKTKICEFI